VLKCASLTEITLITSEEHQEQKLKLAEIANDLTSKKVKLIIRYSPTLHDRSITLSNGWIIRLGRGLDIYKAAPKGKLTLGQFNMDLRQCYETQIDIFHKNDIII